MWRKGESSCSSSSASILSRSVAASTPPQLQHPQTAPRPGHSPTGQPLTWLQPPSGLRTGSAERNRRQDAVSVPRDGLQASVLSTLGESASPSARLRSWSQAPPTAGPPRCSAGGPSAEGSFLAVPWPSWLEPALPQAHPWQKVWNHRAWTALLVWTCPADEPPIGALWLEGPGRGADGGSG